MSVPSPVVAHYREAFDRLRPALHGSTGATGCGLRALQRAGFSGPA